MKNLIYALTISMLLISCEKTETGPANLNPVSKRILIDSEITLKTNLDKAAKVLANVIQDQAVMNELTLLSNENRTFYNLSFKDLFNESKGPGTSFNNLREKFLSECGSADSKGGWNDLAEYLAGNDCYIYCPYPASFYPKGTNSFTVAGHPIDNDEENTGYCFEGNKIVEVTVNETYADKHQVLLIMPKDDDNQGSEKVSSGNSQGSKGEPVYEVLVGKIRCADFCGGLFEGTLELRINRGFPVLNPTTEELSGAFTTAIPIDYPRDYAKAAINGWTVYCNGGWYPVFIPWDTNWKPAKMQQIILAYEYDHVSEASISGTVGYKTENTNVSLTATVKTTYRGKFLGIAEWDRDWFYATNTNPGIYGELKDGWTVRKTSSVFKLTTPARTIYY